MWEKLKQLARRYDEIGELLEVPEIYADPKKLRALTREQKAKLRFTRRVEASLLDEEVSTLSAAKKAHDALESAFHPCVDFEGGTALAEREINRLLKQ